MERLEALEVNLHVRGGGDDNGDSSWAREQKASASARTVGEAAMTTEESEASGMAYSRSSMAEQRNLGSVRRHQPK
jgi:hypothetical protein